MAQPDGTEDRWRRLARTAKKAVNQWLDAPDDRVATPVFVFGCQRSGTTMLIDTLMAAPDLWVHPEKSSIAYDNFRLRSPAVVEFVTRHTPAATVIYKPLCDSHLADRILDAHPTGRALWAVRAWADVANSAVKKWGDHQRDVILQIVHGRADVVGWRGERLPEAVVARLAELAAPGLSPAAGAALFWWLRNSFYLSLGLDQDPRVQVVRYESLVTRPHEAFVPVFEHCGVPYQAAYTAGIVPTSVGRAPAPEVSPAIAAACDALAARLRDT